MKVRKALSGILLGLGCAIAFIGLLALILPAIPNEQLHLVLASFDLPSSHPLVAAMNTGMSFALHHGWQVLFTGLFLLLIGVALFVLFSEPSPRAKAAFDDREAAQPLWEPRPQPQPNPFADMARWDSFAPLTPSDQEPTYAFARYRSPLLEPNRIEEAPAPAFQPVLEPRPVPEDHANLFARPVAEPPKSPIIPQPKQTEDTPPLQPAPMWEPALKPLAKSEPPKTADTDSGHMTFGRSMVRSTFPQPESPAVVENEPVYTPNEEEPPQPTSRIRSTMGLHREW